MMKCLGFVAVTLILLAGCEGQGNGDPVKDGDTTAIEKIPETSGNDIDTPAGERPEKAGRNGLSEATITDEAFLRNGFSMGNVTLEKLQALFEDTRIMDTETRPNRHVPGQTDTIWQVNAANSYFEIVKAGGKQMLQKAEINAGQIGLYRDIEYGMSMSDFRKAFPQLPDDIGAHATVEVQGAGGNVNWKFKFSNGYLREIVYNGYID